ncbi:MAG: hypothetical protein II661_06170 [Bacteroidales bacterium]|nr:hypothetical protein [Bacteroidales bacterium]
MNFGTEFPRQALPFKSKGDKWRRDCVSWAANRTYFSYLPIRKDIVRMKINYDLVNGKIHMDDVAGVLNPGKLSVLFVPEKIQHFPIINAKLNTLRGEEGARVFDWRFIITNPNAISRLEEEKKAQLNASIQQIVENTEIDDAAADKQMQENQEYYDYSYQDRHEIQANELMNHYKREQNFKQIFNDGFIDACICGREVYQIGIVGGEPVLTKLNPIKLRFYGNGSSDKIEDSDLIVYEDYWSRGRVIDTFYDKLSVKDVKRISDEYSFYNGDGPLGAAGNVNEAAQFGGGTFVGENGILIDAATEGFGGVFDELSELPGGIGSDLLPYDLNGNVRVIQVWWKSRRKILRVESFDPVTGDKNFDFYPETYIPNEAAGEKAEPFWINQMWQGTKIGNDIYVDIRPCLVQHNSMSNPSRCHAGIIGTIYNVNESGPYSLVDMMKPYNYLYDAVHAKLVDLIATNWGKLLRLDLAMKPKDWEVDKWIWFARVNKTLIEDSFNEGSYGSAAGKLAGGLNNASKGVVDADWGQSIQNYMNLLQWVIDSMSNLVGINRQREGNTYSRETVGGIERAVLQSSYITDWLFMKHEDTKRRVFDCFIEDAKASMHGGSKKFEYITSDGSRKIMEIRGDEFSECDYGCIADNSQDIQKLESNLDNLAHAGMQANKLNLSSIMRLYTSASLSDKIRIIEKSEKEAIQQQAEQFQQQQQLEQQKIQAELQAKQLEMQQKDMLNQRDNQTKIEVANINAQAEYLRLGIYEDENNEELRREEMQIDKDKVAAEIKKLDEEFKFKREELKQKKEIELKKIEAQKQIAKMKPSTTSKK